VCNIVLSCIKEKRGNDSSASNVRTNAVFGDRSPPVSLERMLGKRLLRPVF
jgi:hypothetical protein